MERLQRFIFMESFFFNDCFDAPGNETMRFLRGEGEGEEVCTFIPYGSLSPGISSLVLFIVPRS